jgi:hypothetical protein
MGSYRRASGVSHAVEGILSDVTDVGKADDVRSGDKITLRLSPDARAALQWISAQYGNVSLAEVIRRALSTEKYLLEQRAKGSSLLIEDTSGRQREIVLR